nr:uncharacterized protein LOC128676083 [Plodia interpunctella]
MAETGTINLMDQNISESTPENEKIMSSSPSVIENSPDRSILYNDPKPFLQHSGKKVLNKCGIELEPELTSKKIITTGELEKEQSKRTRVSSSSSSSSSCSSTSSSSSSDKSNKSNPVINGPSTSSAGKVTWRAKKNYRVSPINSNESDVDLSDSDPTFTVHRSRSSINSSPSSFEESNDINCDPETNRKSRKRQRNPSKWKQNVAKTLRNSGKAYVSCTTKKEIPARSVKGSCKCRLKCPENINDTDRTTLFQSYWSIGNIELQRSYIRSCMMEIKPRYKYTNADKPRLPNNAFYFTVNNIKIRVCKTFFINTLDICDRQIRTVKKKTDPQGFISKDIRGKHASRKPTDPTLIESIRQHIDSIPRIESHYLRANTSREYISGDKTIMDIWRDFDNMRKIQGKSSCEYWLYYDIFNKEFNISFFQPKKDRCDLCLDFELATPNRNIEIKKKYEDHLAEKNLCRQEKRVDRQNINENCLKKQRQLKSETKMEKKQSMR